MTFKTEDFKEYKDFHIGDIITITSGCMVSLKGIGGVYEILNWMTGENHLTHQLPRASRQCEPILKDLYPDLATIVIPNFDHVPEIDQAGHWYDWLGQQVVKFGETLPVPKIIGHTAVDPIAELFEMKGAENVIIVNAVSSYPYLEEKTDAGDENLQS